MHKLPLLPMLFAVCFLFEEGFAQWSADSTVNVKVCQVTGDQKYPEIVSDGARGAIIVWQDGRDGNNKSMHSESIPQA